MYRNVQDDILKATTSLRPSVSVDSFEGEVYLFFFFFCSTAFDAKDEGGAVFWIHFPPFSVTKKKKKKKKKEQSPKNHISRRFLDFINKKRTFLLFREL